MFPPEEATFGTSIFELQLTPTLLVAFEGDCESFV